MSTPVVLNDLLDRWEQAQQRGESLTPEELCVQQPELLEEVKQRIEAIQQVNPRLAATTAADSATRSFSANEDEDDDPTGALTVESNFAELSRHAEGGLGIVYVAKDQQLHRQVALKFIRKRFARQPESRARFLLEAEVTSRLDHPGVVPVYGLGEDESGRQYYAMRYIDGETMEAAIQRFHMPEFKESSPADSILEFRKLLTRFVAVCHTIAYAHNRGIVHRDIKPENVMLGRYGETLVVDWGLATPFERDHVARSSGERTLLPNLASDTSSSASGAGTPAYMSPEQALGDENLGPASDVYSLGATLYKILTGKAAIRGDNPAAVLRRLQNGIFSPPSKVNPKVPRAMEAICLKAMARDPEDRYSGAADLAQEIERWLADERVLAYREPAARKLARWARRHRAAAQTLVAALLLVVLIVVVAAIQLGSAAGRERLARRIAEYARRQGLLSSAELAAHTVADDIDNRWTILRSEADDPDIRALLTALNEGKIDESSLAPVQAWLDAKRQDHYEKDEDPVWVVSNRAGVLLATSPANASRRELYGKSFAHRDWFHGQGRELADNEAGNTKPIESPHLSRPFRSKADKKELKVAFSVPIWSGRPGTAGRRVLGVLAMTVGLSKFGTLITEAPGQAALLVDLGNDYSLDEPGEVKTGAILHHPQWRETTSKTLRLRSDLVEFLAEFRLRHNHPAFLPDYADPNQHSGTPMIAAFAPVNVKGRGQEIANTPWVLLMQTNEQPEEFR